MKLTEAQTQHLHDLALCSDRPQPETAALVKRGLAEQGQGKFGEWARLTEKGYALARSKPMNERVAREAVSIGKMFSTAPAAATKAAGILGGSAPRCRSVEKKAGSHRAPTAITPPAEPLKSGGDRSMPPATRPRGATPPQRNSGVQAAPVMPAASRSKRVAPSPAPLHPPRGSATATRAKQPAPPSAAAPSPKRTPPGPRVASKAAADPSPKQRASRSVLEKTPRPAAKSAAMSAHNDTGQPQPNAYRMLFGRKYVYYSLKDGAKLSGSKDRVRTECRLNRPTPVGSPESDKDILC